MSNDDSEMQMRRKQNAAWEAARDEVRKADGSWNIDELNEALAARVANDELYDAHAVAVGISARQRKARKYQLKTRQGTRQLAIWADDAICPLGVTENGPQEIEAQSVRYQHWQAMEDERDGAHLREAADYVNDKDVFRTRRLESDWRKHPEKSWRQIEEEYFGLSGE